ncbi:DUF4190 domain-containing protein [Nocardioides sp. BGMRC 2183]|nr:DUF4190 domain-containing protein [Nocardioides sp. BGMRC 2183]
MSDPRPAEDPTAISPDRHPAWGEAPPEAYVPGPVGDEPKTDDDRDAAPLTEPLRPARETPPITPPGPAPTGPTPSASAPAASAQPNPSPAPNPYAPPMPGAPPAAANNPYLPPGAGPYPTPGYFPPPSPPTHPTAVTACVLGIVSIVSLLLTPIFVITIVGGLCAPFAVWLGRRAQREIRENPQAYSGDGLATAGFVTGIIGCVLDVLALLAIIGFILLLAWAVSESSASALGGF